MAGITCQELPKGGTRAPLPKSDDWLRDVQIHSPKFIRICRLLARHRASVSPRALAAPLRFSLRPSSSWVFTLPRPAFYRSVN